MKFFYIFSLLLVATMFFSMDFNIQASFDPESLTITATLCTKNNIKSFLLLPNYASKDNPYLHALFEGASGSMDILSVTDGKGNEIDYTLETYPATLLGDETLRRDTMLLINEDVDKVIIHFKTHIKSEQLPEEGGYNDFILYRFGWYPLPIEDQKGLRIKPHRWQLSMQLPEGWEAVVGGEKKGSSSWKSCGNYLSCPIALVKRDSYEELSFPMGDLRVVVHFRRGFEGVASKLAAFAIQVLEHHIKKLGALRYSTIHIVQDPFPGLYGITADGLIAIGDGFFTSANLWVNGLLDPLTFYLVAHELSHLWFGVGTGVDFLRNNFMSESLADYVAHSTTLEIYGKDYYMNWKASDLFTSFIKSYFDIPTTVTQADQLMLLYAKMAGVKAAVADPVDVIPQNFSSAVYYQKGKRAFFSLEELLGREKLYSILSRYYRLYVGKNVTTREFVDFLEGYINPKVVNALFFERDNYDARIYFENGIVKIDNENMKVPLRVVIETPEGSRSFVTLDSTSLPYIPAMQVHLDPDMHSFDIERHNNHWPPLFKGGYSEEQSRYDAYLLSTHGIVGFSASGLDYTGEILFEKFPYYGIGLLNQSGYSSDDGRGYSYTGASLYLHPDLYRSLEMKYSKFEGIHLSMNLGIPEKLYIGDSSPILIARHNFSVEGRFLDTGNYYIQGLYSFNDTLKHGLYLEIEGLTGEINATPTYMGGFYGSWIPNVNSELIPSLNLLAVGEALGKRFFDPFYDVLSFEATSNALDPLMSKYPPTSYLLDFRVSLPYMIIMNRRISFLNLFNLGGIGISWELGSRIFDSGYVFDASMILSPIIYIIGDTPLQINLGFSFLMDAEGTSTLGIKGGISFGSSIYFNEKLGFSGMEKVIKWKNSGLQ